MDFTLNRTRNRRKNLLETSTTYGFVAPLVDFA